MPVNIVIFIKTLLPDVAGNWGNSNLTSLTAMQQAALQAAAAAAATGQRPTAVIDQRVHGLYQQQQQQQQQQHHHHHRMAAPQMHNPLGKCMLSGRYTFAFFSIMISAVCSRVCYLLKLE